MLRRHQQRAALAAFTASAIAVAGAVAAAAPASAADSRNGRELTVAAQQPVADGPTIEAAVAAAKGTVGKDGRAHVVVKLKDKSLATYTGGVAGLPATSPRVTGKRTLDPSTPEARRYTAYFNGRVSSFKARASAAAPDARFGTVLSTVVGGVAVSVPPDQVKALASDPQVAAVLPDRLAQIQVADRSPGFIGAPSAWAQQGGPSKAGEGIIVGVLDSGIWPEHPSLSDPDPSGKPYTAPRPRTDNAPRKCEFGSAVAGDAPFTCNNKLIGAYRFLDTYAAAVGFAPGELTSVRDDDGHGTHTATTAAGNYNVPASIFGVSRGTVSGIAPRAHVIAYRVCGSAGCFSSDSARAVQEAIKDRVDVINFSISGGANPYTDVVSLAFRDAYDAGIFVAASAGNSGPGADTTDHREPWVTTVAASTLDRSFVGTSTLTSTDGATLTVTGTTISQPLTTAAPVVNAAAAPYNDPLCLNGSADGAYAGRVVLCMRGGNGRVAKGENVLTRGGVGMILYNQSTSVTDLETDNHFLPAVHVQVADGQAVAAFLTAHPGVTATITSGTAAPAQGDVMASFSSRGGPGQSLGISKPDVTAPGVQILAGNTPLAAPTGQLFQAIAGTSMSSPHVAGAGAMLKALHPTWTPGQIKSALMTTAVTNVVKEDGTTPTDAFDDGSGRIDLRRAPSPLFTISDTGANYTALQSALYKSNYPSLYVPALAGSLTVNRTLASVVPYDAEYTATVRSSSGLKVSVSPSRFTVKKNSARTIAISLDGRDIPLGETRFATVTFRGPRGATSTFPVTVVRKQGPVAITNTCAPDPVAKGATTDCSITLTNNATTDATVSVKERVPSRLEVVRGSVVGGSVSRGVVSGTLTIPGKQAPGITVAAGSTPAGGYLPLSAFGIAPIAGVGDETITNFNVPAFSLAGVTYSRVGVVSNGYVVLGGGTGADVDFLNTNLPSASRPNNIVAPFWTDLNPGAAGAVRIGSLTDGVSTWLVIDYDAVKEYSTAKVNSFQVWIQVGGTEDVSMAYGTVQGDGDGGLLTVGAENPDGTRGQAVYFNGTGTLPNSTTQLAVTGTPGVTSSATLSFRARGDDAGPYVAYAEATGPFDGTAIARFAGSVTP